MNFSRNDLRMLAREINLFFKEDEIIDWHDENAKWF